MYLDGEESMICCRQRTLFVYLVNMLPRAEGASHLTHMAPAFLDSKASTHLTAD